MYVRMTRPKYHMCLCGATMQHERKRWHWIRWHWWMQRHLRHWASRSLTNVYVTLSELKEAADIRESERA